MKTNKGFAVALARALPSRGNRNIAYTDYSSGELARCTYVRKEATHDIKDGWNPGNARG